MANSFKIFRSFSKTKRGNVAVEFALSGLALFAFLMAILNLGLLGFSIGALVHGVQAAARKAGLDASASYATSTNNTMTCDSSSIIQGYFDSYADPPLPASGTNPVVTANWTNNTGSTTGNPPGVFLTLSATYKWVPFGFALFGKGFTIGITTVAVVDGSMNCAVTVGASC